MLGDRTRVVGRRALKDWTEGHSGLRRFSLTGLAWTTFFWVAANYSPSCGCNGSVSLPWCTVTPCPGREAINMESSQVTAPTNATLNIRNVGQMSVNLISYFVKDSNGRIYTNTNWPGPAFEPNSLVVINIFIDGSSFTFQSRNTYTITLITARNNQFTFQIST